MTNNQPDWRALCAELLSALENEGYAHWVVTPDEDRLCLRARTALTQPEPEGPTELIRALELAEIALADIGDSEREPGADLAWAEKRAALVLPCIRAVLARWGKYSLPLNTMEQQNRPSDFRELCADLVKEWEKVEDGDFFALAPLMDRARAYLDQPEPQAPSKHELFQVLLQSGGATKCVSIEWLEPFANAVLARWGQ